MAEQQTAHLKIMGVTGKIFRNEQIEFQEGTNNMVLETSALPTSNYFIVLTSSTKTIARQLNISKKFRSKHSGDAGLSIW